MSDQTPKPTPPSTLAFIRAWITQAKNEVLVAFLATLATVCFLFAPETRWQSLSHFVESVVTNPTGAIGAASALGSIVGAFVLAWRSGRTPGASLLVIALLGTLATGCGAQLTSDQRTALAVRTQLCLMQERAIVDDPCGSLSPEECEARDTAALAASRALCDADRAAIVGGGQ